jgi:2-hydroxy-6-oxonona-2,4-dienedioate hydrolase
MNVKEKSSMNIDRYRQVEQRLWQHAGVTPRERRVRLPRLNVEVRVMETGDGPPALFIHGGPNAGSTWAELAAKLPHLRCLMLDRPGTGLSEPYPADAKSLPAFADVLVSDVLDALEIERADLVVSSFGGYVALRSAAAHPDRVGRTVQMGCPGFVPGMIVPRSMKMMLLPGMSRLIPMLPPSEKEIHKSMRHLGHGKSVDEGRIAPEFIAWYMALQRDTPTMRNELAMIAALSSWRGFDPSLTLSEDLLSRVTSPTHFYWGEDDTFGGAEVARNLVALMPSATLELVPDSGHLPWGDDPAAAARAVMSHLGEPSGMAGRDRRDNLVAAG